RSLPRCFLIPLDLLHPSLLSFPTRRSSDLWVVVVGWQFEGRKLFIEFFSGRSLNLFNWLHFQQVSIDFAQCNRQWFLVQLSIDQDRKSTRLNSSHVSISYAVFCLKKKTHIT